MAAAVEAAMYVQAPLRRPIPEQEAEQPLPPGTGECPLPRQAGDPPVRETEAPGQFF
jgi:hypothetical protein